MKFLDGGEDSDSSSNSSEYQKPLEFCLIEFLGPTICVSALKMSANTLSLKKFGWGGLGELFFEIIKCRLAAFSSFEVCFSLFSVEVFSPSKYMEMPAIPKFEFCLLKIIFFGEDSRAETLSGRTRFSSSSPNFLSASKGFLEMDKPFCLRKLRYLGDHHFGALHLKSLNLFYINQ